MKLQVKYFGMVQEALGIHQEEFEINTSTNISAIIDMLEKKYPSLKELKFVVAKDLQIVPKQTKIETSCELALLPPFAGG